MKNFPGVYHFLVVYSLGPKVDSGRGHEGVYDKSSASLSLIILFSIISIWSLSGGVQCPQSGSLSSCFKKSMKLMLFSLSVFGRHGFVFVCLSLPTVPVGRRGESFHTAPWSQELFLLQGLPGAVSPFSRGTHRAGAQTGWAMGTWPRGAS